MTWSEIVAWTLALVCSNVASFVLGSGLGATIEREKGGKQ